MDGSFKHAGNAVTAMVVRQFTPSRIERQLLAQVFELVCARRCAVEESGLATQAATGTQRFGDGEHVVESHNAGRRAA